MSVEDAFCSAAQSGPDGPLAIVPRGWAVRVSVSPLAMPIRLEPEVEREDGG